METTRNLLFWEVALLSRYFNRWHSSLLIARADRRCYDTCDSRRQQFALQRQHQQERELILRAKAWQAAQCADRARRLLISRWADSEARLLLRRVFCKWQNSCAPRDRITVSDTSRAPIGLERLCLIGWRHLTAAGSRARNRMAKHVAIHQRCNPDKHVLQCAAFAGWKSQSCSKKEAEERRSREQKLQGIRGVAERLKTKVAWLRSKVQRLYCIITSYGEGSGLLNLCGLLIRIWTTWKGAAAAVARSWRVRGMIGRITHQLVSSRNGWAVHASFLAWLHHWKAECRHHLHKAKDRIIGALDTKLKGMVDQKRTRFLKYAVLCGQNQSDPLVRYVAFRLWRRGSTDGSLTDRSKSPRHTPRASCRSEQSPTPSTWDFSPVSDASLSDCFSMSGSECALSFDQTVLLALCLKDWRWQSTSQRYRRCRHDAYDRLKAAHVAIQQLELNEASLHHQLRAASEEIELVTMALQIELQTKADLVKELHLAWEEAQRLNCRFPDAALETGSDGDALMSRSSSQQTLDPLILSTQQSPVSDAADTWLQCEPGACSSTEFEPLCVAGTFSIGEQCVAFTSSRSARAQSMDSTWIDASGITVQPPEEYG